MSIPRGTASVANVDDFSKGTSGAGNLIIKGTYWWGRPDQNKREASPWSGAGTAQVGTDTERSAKLILGGVIHGTQRALVSYGRIEWKSSTIQATFPVPLPNDGFDWKALSFSTRGVETKGRSEPNVFDHGMLEIDAANGFRMSMSGDLKNAGRVQATADPAEVDGQEVHGIEFGGKVTDVGEGRVDIQTRTGKGKIKVNGETKLSMGSINVGPGVHLELAGGLNQAGGDFVASGARVDISGTYTFSGGTADFDGTLDGRSLVTGAVEQTGGTLTV